MTAPGKFVAIYWDGNRHFQDQLSASGEEEAGSIALRHSGLSLCLLAVMPVEFATAGGWNPDLPRPAFDEMCRQAVKAWAAHKARQLGAPAVGVKPAPQLPPEVWQTERADADRAMAAVRAMCGSSS